MPLLGPCCFLPLIFAAFPDALSLLLPPPPAAFPFVLFRWLASFCLFCCPACLTLLFATPLPCRLLSFLVFLSGVWSGLPCLLVGFVLSFLLWVWRDVLAACLLRRLRTTKDYQPQHHTHTHHSAFLPPVTVGGWFVSVFGIGPFFGCLGCSVASSY